MTELLFQAWSDPRSEVVVSSAGVQALVGEPMDPGSAAAMRELGLDPSGHRARQFQPAMAAEADLILAAERYHLETVLHRAPTALRRTFTIKEFARIARHLRPGPAQRAVAQAAAVRGLVPRPADPTADDVADPHGQPLSVNRATAAELTTAVKAIVPALEVVREPRARRPLPYRR